MANNTKTIIEKREIQVVTVGEQGARGIQGWPGPAGASVELFIAGEALGGHRAVKTDVLGQAVYASNDDVGSQSVLGITIAAVDFGGTAQVQRQGRIEEPSWTWVPGVPVFVGTGGSLTQVYPTGASVAVILGFALTATSMYLAPREPILLS